MFLTTPTMQKGATIQTATSSSRDFLVGIPWNEIAYTVVLAYSLWSLSKYKGRRVRHFVASHRVEAYISRFLTLYLSARRSSKKTTEPAISNETPTGTRGLCSASSPAPFEYKEVEITSACENVKLCANVFLPPGSHLSVGTDDVTVPREEATPQKVEDETLKKFPAIIFVNSWTYTEHQYLVQAVKFAQKGYIVLSYCTRGFGKSGGQVNVAGNKDREDLSSVLDWLEGHTNIDMDNIGMCGISYGAGIALVGLATQRRVKTVVAMGGWADLEDCLFGRNTPRQVWGLLLLEAGYLSGDMDPTIKHQFYRMLKRRSLPALRRWAEERSPASLVNGINDGKKPVYLCNSFSDDLFHPNQILDFFDQLEGPKRLDLSQGIHGMPDFYGLMGFPMYIWDNAHDWFDHYLRGQTTGIADRDPFTMEAKFGSDRDEFPSWPCELVKTKTYTLEPRSWVRNGRLIEDVRKADEVIPASDEVRTTIYSGLPTAANTGIPLLSSLAESHVGCGIYSLLCLVCPFNGVVYTSGRIEDAALRVRGRVQLSLRISSSIGIAHMVVYLFDLAMLGVSKLITHGTVTEHNLLPGVATPVQMELNATAYNVPKGHRLAVVIATCDALYAVPTTKIYSLSFWHHSTMEGKTSTLEVPYID